MSKAKVRNTHTLRNILFEEIEELRSGSGDPKKAMAVANLSKQIIGIAKVEMQYHRMVSEAQETGNVLKLGAMELGSDAASAAPAVTDQQSTKMEEQAA